MLGGRNMKMFNKAIKESLTEILEETQPSPLGKDETWNRIQKQMAISIRTNHTPRKRYVYIAASVIIIAFVAFSSSPQHASASFGWLTKLFVQIEGTLTQLMGTTSSPDNEIMQAPAPAFNIATDQITLEKLTIEEARSATTFRIIVPKYLPEGYIFSGVFVQAEENKKSSHILIKYNDGEGNTLEFTETDINDQRGYSIGIDNDDTDIVDINISGVKGNILSFKNGTKKVVINMQNIQLVIDSKLSDMELREIVKNL